MSPQDPPNATRLQVNRRVPVGVVLDGLLQLPQLVEALYDHPDVRELDYSVLPPLRKATPELAEHHQQARSARERLLLYLTEGLLRPDLRRQVSENFCKQYVQRFGSSEFQDIRLASANLLEIAIRLRPLTSLDIDMREAVVEKIRANPHDRAALDHELEVSALRRMPTRDAPGYVNLHTYRLELKLFIADLYNRARHKEPEVEIAVARADFARPVIFEFWLAPAIPGYGYSLVEDLAQELGGCAVWMERREQPR